MGSIKIIFLFSAIPELVSVLYENQQYHPKFQYLTGVARDDASNLLCKFYQLYDIKFIM